MDRGLHFLSLRRLHTRFKGHKGDFIHHVENSLELSPHVSGYQVITRFLTKVILGRETQGRPFKRHLILLHKVHDASSKFLVDFYDAFISVLFCAILVMSHMKYGILFYTIKYYVTESLGASGEK